MGTEYGLHNLFIDFQAADGTVWRKGIWSEMHKLGFPPPQIANLCRIVNNEIYAKVKIGKHLSSEFKVNGLRQGDVIAPLLFNVLLEIAIISSKEETRGTIFDKCIQIMAFGDVVVVMG